MHANLKTLGIGTALRILFDGGGSLKLQRNEVIVGPALFGLTLRLSSTHSTNSPTPLKF
jgi:hypothetical protein